MLMKEKYKKSNDNNEKTRKYRFIDFHGGCQCHYKYWVNTILTLALINSQLRCLDNIMFRKATVDTWGGQEEGGGAKQGKRKSVSSVYIG